MAPNPTEQDTSQARRLVVLMATYNDWQSVLHLLPEIDQATQALGLPAEIAIVDDGSIEEQYRDDIRSLSFRSVERITFINLARNLGNQRAMAVGIAWVAENMPCDYLVLMDADHEDRPEYIPALIEACDRAGRRSIIFAERAKRFNGPMFHLLYGVYRWLYRALTGTPISFGNFSVIPGPMVKRVASTSEIWNHLPAGILRARLSYTTIPAERGPRLFGHGKMNLTNLVVHAISGFAVHADVAGVRVILATLLLGSFVAAAIAVVVALRLFTDIPLVGWTSQITALMLTLLFQALTAALVLVFMILSTRLQVPLVPLWEYKKFVLSTEKIIPSRSLGAGE